METKKLSFGTKFGYSIGMIGECVAMNTFYIYFLFFLTDAVGMAAGIAGTVASVATFWGAFTDLIAGSRSDNSKNPKGRRRPMMVWSAIGLGIMTFLLYTDWAVIPMAGKVVYFIIVAAAFWLFLSFADIPYQTLGAEITDDYEDKNSIRGIANILNYAGMILASAATLALVSMFFGAGSTYTGAWSKVAAIFGIVILVSYIIAVATTKGKEPANPNVENADNGEKAPKISVIAMCKDAFSIKPFRSIILYVIFGYGGILILTSIYIYFLTNNLGMTQEAAAGMGLIYCIAVMILSAIFGQIKIEKRTVVVVCTGFAGVVLVIMHFLGISAGAGVYVMFFALGLAIAAFFVQIYSMVYDVCDIDEFKSGGSRAGSIISFFYFFMKFIGGFTMLAVGWILQGAGYDAMAAVQSAATLNGISMGTLLLPGILLIIGALVMIKYPINKKNSTALRAAIDAKNAGEEYSTEDFKELL